MKTLARVVARIALLAAAAALFMGLTSMWAGAIQPSSTAEAERIAERRREPGPRMRSLTNFVLEAVLFALIATGGRVVLRLRLTDEG